MFESSSHHKIKAQYLYTGLSFLIIFIQIKQVLQMESDSINSDKQTKSDYKQKQNSDNLPNGRHIFFTSRLRHTVQKHYDVDRFLLDYGFYFLLPVSLFLYFIFFIIR